ncbi:hypothetical protein [Sphingomonas sp. MMS24-J13]|uniref:hypothetical protein n=1 Tax=Sphingomonas sp. MMS24-J13 TaxID=3238686 RepID=UPI003850F91F
MRYQPLLEWPDAGAQAFHIVRSGLDGDLPGELRETAERGNHLLAVMPAGRAPLQLRAQLGSIGSDRIAILALSLSGAVLASARFDLGRIETMSAADCDAECRSTEGGVEIDVAFAAAAQPRFLAIALLRDGALAYEGDPARGIGLHMIAIGYDATEAPAEPAPTEQAPAPAIEPPTATTAPDRAFHALSQWLDLVRGEAGHSYAWRSGQRRRGALVLVREAHTVQLRIESVSAADDGVELRVPAGSCGFEAVVATLTHQLEQSVDVLDDGETRAMARSAIADLDRFVAPLFSDSAEAMLVAER